MIGILGGVVNNLKPLYPFGIMIFMGPKVLMLGFVHTWNVSAYSIICMQILILVLANGKPIFVSLVATTNIAQFYNEYDEKSNDFAMMWRSTFGILRLQVSTRWEITGREMWHQANFLAMQRGSESEGGCVCAVCSVLNSKHIIANTSNRRLQVIDTPPIGAHIPCSNHV